MATLNIDWDPTRGLGAWQLDTRSGYYVHYFPSGYQVDLSPRNLQGEMSRVDEVE